jgi:hypothetical protein
MKENWILLVDRPRNATILGYSPLMTMDIDQDIEVFESEEKAIEYANMYHKEGYNNIYICKIVPDTKLSWSKQAKMEKL